jgi:hypothetical protein
MEAERAEHDLNPAFKANAYSASQALYNMYVWMFFAGDVDTFLRHVRVFTVALNARELAIRSHRAEFDSQERLCFKYDDIVPQFQYTPDQACRLIQSILVAYGAEELHQILKRTFEKVVDALLPQRLRSAE